MKKSHPTPLPFDALNALDESGFMQLLGGVVELSPWVVQQTWHNRPFASREAVFETLRNGILDAPREAQMALLRSHPELAGREAVAGTMTPESNAEQSRLGLLALSRVDLEQLNYLNRRYRERFGMPFVVALRLHATLNSVFADFDKRLGQSADEELQNALQQVCAVMRGRLEQTIAEIPAVKAEPT
ncbi:MAG: 2-oxo-4-hydroxy-4-carboxy-5-ureidoimidazoline decarboxylase [Burkholderiaceae bacterium]